MALKIKTYNNVQANVTFSKASSRVEINPTAGEAATENIALTLGKISKWYEALVPTGGSSGKILAWNTAGTAKWSDPLHPTITLSADTTSTPAQLSHGGTFTAITSVTREGNGHVTKINTATYTLPNDTSMTQTNTTRSADYRVLLSGNANDTTETTTGRKSTNLRYNPGTKSLYTGYYGSDPSITARLTSLNFTSSGAGIGRTKVRFDLVTTSLTTGAPPAESGKNSGGHVTTYSWDSNIDVMTQIYIPNGDHVGSSYGPQPLMIRGDDSGTWLDWRGIATFSQSSGSITSGQVVITDGTLGLVKASGYTIAKSVPSDAAFTDTKVTQSSSTTSDFRPLLLGKNNQTNPENLETTVTDQTYVTKHVFVQPSTGNLTLYNTSGDSPSLIFRRGTMIDNTLEWRIQNVGGKLNFDRDKNESTETWENIFQLDPSNNKMYFKNTEVSLSGHTHSQYLPKTTYEWNKEISFGNSGYLKIGSFPMYDTNITIDINATTSKTYHGTVVIATQNVSTTSMGSQHIIHVYDDPTGNIAASLRIVWTSGSRNYDIYFIPQSWSKNFIHIRALGNYMDGATDICVSQTGTAPATTSGLEPVNILSVTSTGNGNAVTKVEIDSVGNLAVTKESTFSLSTHKHDSLYGVQSSSAVPVTTLADGQLKVFYNVNKDLTGNMPATNNANAIIQISKHHGNYDAQLGFSSNGSIYYRCCDNVVLSDSVPWRRILDSSNTSFTQTLSSGTKIGTIKINGTSTDLYCETNTNTDTKVTQTNTTTSADYRVLLSGNANDTTETTTGRKSANLKFNPSSGGLYSFGFLWTDITGSTLDINTLTLSNGTLHSRRFIEKTDGGAANITNIPVTGHPFLLEVDLIRWGSTTDYITRQRFTNAANGTYSYVRYCTNGTWGSWTTRKYTDTDTKVTSSANHYTPSTVSGQDKSDSASGAIADWNIDVVTGVTLNTDGKGHVTGISVTSGKIPGNPVPSNNVTGSGTSGYLTKWNGTNTITNGPKLGSSTTTYLRNDGEWVTPPDTKNTAGSTDTSSKIYLIGATSQAANPQTYSDNEVYTTSGVLTTKKVQVGGGSCTMEYNSTTQSLDFIFT